MASSSFKNVRGVRHVSGGTARCFRRNWDAFMKVARSYGYEEIFLPLLEDASLFERGLGLTSDVVSKELYRFEDQGGQMLTLRPEGTAGAMRAFLDMGAGSLPLPQRLFYGGAMFRRERPQKGRYRQFYQVGIECIGDGDAARDVEIIMMAEAFMKSLSLRHKASLHLNSLGDDESRILWREALVKHFSQHEDALSPRSRERLKSNPLRILDSKEATDRAVVADAPVIDDFFTPKAGAFFEQLQQQLQRWGISYHRAPHLVRGLDYYGHTAFEYVVADGLGAQNTVLAGGRYNGLASMLGGDEIPAVGWAAGMDRLALLNEKEDDSHSLLWVLPTSQDEAHEATLLAEELRALGMEVIVDERGSLSKRLDKARKRAARYVMVMGEDEIRQETIVLRDFQKGEQQSIKRADLADTLLRALASAIAGGESGHA